MLWTIIAVLLILWLLGVVALPSIGALIHVLLVLALIVLIRTFLSMALQVEIDGRWPWQSRASTKAPRR